MTNKLWPHQVEAIEQAHKGLSNGGRATEVMACGTGKTRVAAEASVRLAAGGRRLIFAPTVILLAQTLTEYRRTVGDAALGRVLVVCSDKEAGRTGADELTALHVEVTTDPAVIAQVASGPGPVTVLCTLASMEAVNRAHRLHGLNLWDFEVIDEAHRTVMGRSWSRLHHDGFIPARRRLYMTATPRQFTGDRRDADVVGMDEESVFGPVVYRLGYATAIDLGLLAEYRLVVSVVTREEIHALTRQPAGVAGIKVGSAVVSAQMLATQVALLRATAQYGLTRAITYHNRTAEARHFAATLPAVTELMPAEIRPRALWAEDLSHGHPAEIRHARLARLAAGNDGGLSVLSNARLLSEGVDVPAVDAVLFADRRSSLIDIIQAIGRAGRLGGRKDKVATIIVPLLAPAGSDPSLRLEGSEFAAVWRVVQALRAHDDRLAADLDHRRSTRGSGEAENSPLRWLHVEGADVPASFAKAISVRAVESASASWEEYFGAACAYRKRYGHLDVPNKWVTQNKLHLGKWLQNQQRNDRANILHPERAERLRAIGMRPLREAMRERGYAAAVRYHNRYGNLDVPDDYIDEEDGINLGRWVSTQRSTIKKGEMPDERYRRLRDLGIVEDVFNALWDSHFAEAVTYHKDHGDLNVPRDFVVTKSGFKLGDWLYGLKQRVATLPAARREALTRLGFDWGDMYGHGWERHYHAAAEYHNKYGHLNVPPNLVTDGGLELGKWIRRNRRATISDDQRERLDKLGMIWDPDGPALIAAAACVKEYGHLRVPVKYIGAFDFPLGKWLQTRRTRFDRLPARLRDRLNALDPEWARKK